VTKVGASRRSAWDGQAAGVKKAEERRVGSGVVDPRAASMLTGRTNKRRPYRKLLFIGDFQVTLSRP
jgi:hypothetical protein